MGDGMVVVQAALVALVIISVGWGLQAGAQRRARRRRRQMIAAGRVPFPGDRIDRAELRPAEWRPRTRVTDDAGATVEPADVPDLHLDLTTTSAERVEQAFAHTEAWGRAAMARAATEAPEPADVDETDDVVFVTPDPSAVRWSISPD